VSSERVTILSLPYRLLRLRPASDRRFVTSSVCYRIGSDRVSVTFLAQRAPNASRNRGNDALPCVFQATARKSPPAVARAVRVAP